MLSKWCDSASVIVSCLSMNTQAGSAGLRFCLIYCHYIMHKGWRSDEPNDPRPGSIRAGALVVPRALVHMPAGDFVCFCPLLLLVCICCTAGIVLLLLMVRLMRRFLVPLSPALLAHENLL